MQIPANSVLTAKPLRRIDLETLPDVLVRTEVEDDSKRSLQKLYRKETARQWIGEIAPGFHRWGFSKGQFSLIDIIAEVQRQLGELDELSVSTWTIAAADLNELHRVLTAARIKTFRLLVDLSFQRRQPALIAHLREQFGADSIRVTRNHAKFLLFRAGNYRIVCRTSMNLNLNPRLEDIELKDDPGLFDFLDSILIELFRTHEAKSQIARTVKELGDQFRAFSGNDDGV